jgi:Ca2+-binding EF-hand superfamily protein
MIPDDDVSSEASSAGPLSDKESNVSVDDFDFSMESEDGGDANAAPPEETVKVPGPPLTEAQTSECMKVFATFDMAGDGSVATEDIGKMLRLLEPDLTDEEVAEIVSKVTSVGGSIDATAFLAIMAEEIETSEIKKVFSQFDPDGDGQISTENVGAAAGALFGRPLTKNELDDLMEEASNENGVVSLAMFAAYVSRKKTEKRLAEQNQIAGEREASAVLEAKTEKCMAVFSSFDKNGDGTIAADDLGAVLRSIDPNITEEEIAEIASKSSNVDGLIDAIVLSALVAEKIENDEIKAVFEHADKENLGAAVEELLGHAFTEAELKDIVGEISDENENVTLEVFRQFVARRRNVAKAKLAEQTLEPREYIGRQLMRDSGPLEGFKGTIVSFGSDAFTGNLLYKVMYADGGEEDMLVDELRRQLLPLNKDGKPGGFAGVMNKISNPAKPRMTTGGSKEPTHRVKGRKKKRQKPKQLDDIKKLIHLTTSLTGKHHSKEDAKNQANAGDTSARKNTEGLNLGELEKLTPLVMTACAVWSVS